MSARKKSLDERRISYEAMISLARKRVAMGTQAHNERKLLREYDASPDAAFAAWIKQADDYVNSAGDREKVLRPKILEALRVAGPFASVADLRAVLRCDDRPMALAIEALIASGQVVRSGGDRKGAGLRLTDPIAPPSPSRWSFAQQPAPAPAAPQAPDVALLALSDALLRRDKELEDLRRSFETLQADYHEELRNSANDQSVMRSEIDRLTRILDEKTSPGGAA